MVRFLYGALNSEGDKKPQKTKPSAMISQWIPVRDLEIAETENGFMEPKWMSTQIEWDLKTPKWMVKIMENPY